MQRRIATNKTADSTLTESLAVPVQHNIAGIRSVTNRKQIWLAGPTAWDLFNFRANLIRALLSNGSDVTIFAPYDEYVPRLEALGARHVPMRLDPSGVNPLTESLALTRIASVLRAQRPSMLLTFTPKVNIYGALAGPLAGVPVITNVSGLGRGFHGRGWLHWVSLALYRSTFRRPDRILFQNSSDMNEFLRRGFVAANRVEHIPGSGVDLVRFHPDKRSAGARPFTFLMSARLLWEKGVSQFVDAARLLKPKYPSVRWCILGFVDANPSAIPISTINNWAREGVIDYLGKSDDVSEELAHADVAVLPSYYREGVPRTLLEAAAMGLPIITTDWPGCRDAIRPNVTGLLAEPRDSISLANAMERMLKLSNAERAQMGRAGREFVEQSYDEEKVIDRYLRLVKQHLRS
jgi:glycosyltransferase involved in cell wall biosynthesis